MMPRHTGDASLSPTLAIFAAFLGGLGAVAAETMLCRKAALLFGVTTPATATVVALYLAGLAAGSLLGGRLADRLGAKSAFLYVISESFALIWALLLPPLFHLMNALVGHFPLSWNLAACALLSPLLVGPAALAAGLSLPALIRTLGRERLVPHIYATNALGAAFAAFLAGIWAPSTLGVDLTLIIAGASCLIAALLVAIGSRMRSAPIVQLRESSEGELGPAAALWAYVLIATLGMAAEVGWTRLLEQVGPNSGSSSFAMVLAAYLLGLACGGLALAARRSSGGERALLGLVAMLAGIGTLAPLALLRLLPEERIIGHLVGEGPFNGLIFQVMGIHVSLDRLLLHLGGVAVVGFASGIAFPVAVGALARGAGRLGWSVGRAIAAGTIAGVFVSLYLGFLPPWGPSTVRVMVGLGILTLGLGAWMLMQAGSRARWVSLALVPLSLLCLLLPPWTGLQLAPGERMLLFRESPAGPSAITDALEAGFVRGSPQDEQGGRGGDISTLIYTHGERVGGMPQDLTVPLLLHEHPENVLLIALGTGVNAAAMIRDPMVYSVTCVDIDGNLPELVERVPSVGPELFNSGKVVFVEADGRHFLKQQPGTYDLIYSDVAVYAQYMEMGTREFFELARRRLSGHGMLALKIHANSLSERGFRRFIATFIDIFPHSGLFSGQAGVGVLVGFTSPPSSRTLHLRATSLAWLYGGEAEERILHRLLAGPSALASLAEGPVATDDKPLALQTALIGPMSQESLERSAFSWIQGQDLSEFASATELLRRSRSAESRWAGQMPPVPPRRPWRDHMACLRGQTGRCR